MIHAINKFVAVFILAVLLAGQAAAQGINFQHISLDEALAQAKKQDKLIFIDFYTAWCGPCKKLAAGPFKEPANGDFFNRNFINLKLDAEKEGREAAKRYQVVSYPTLVFVNADGELVHRGGSRHGMELIAFGKEALNAATSKYSWEKLQEMFPNKQDDEAFLKLYWQKMKEFGTKPSAGIDAWLKVQTEMDESSREMMDFLLKNQSYLYCGSKAEDIFNANYAHYLEMATGNQTKLIERFRNSIYKRSLRMAYRTEDPALVQVLSERFVQYGIHANVGEDLNKLKLDYHRFSKENDVYKRLAEVYVDSLMALESIKEIHAKDAECYEQYAKGKVKGEDEFTDLMLQKYKEGIIANDLVEAIVGVGKHYLRMAETKKEMKTLNQWIDYCYELIPGEYLVDNLKADMLFSQGETKEAIALKEAAIEKMPFNLKKKVNYEHELHVMQQAD